MVGVKMEGIEHVPDKAQNLSITVKNLFLLVAKLKRDIDDDNLESLTAERFSGEASEITKEKLLDDKGSRNLTHSSIFKVCLNLAGNRFEWSRRFGHCLSSNPEVLSEVWNHPP